VRRLPLVLLLSFAVVGLVSGCGDDDGGSSSPTTAASTGGSGSVDQGELDQLVDSLSGSDGPGISKADARCVGKAALPKLSAKAKRSMFAKDDSGNFSDLTDAEQEAVIDAFDRCVKTADIAAAIAKETGSGQDALSAEAVDCIESTMVERYPTSGQLMRLVLADSPDAFQSLITGCIPQTDIEQQLHDEFVSRGMTEEQASCVAAAVSAEVSADDLVAASQGSTPANVEQVITSAVQTCGVGG
jgi:hypothetical protein